MGLMSRRKRPAVADPDRLAKEIQAVLSDGLIKPRYRVRASERRSTYNGHCYHASEAYLYLASSRTRSLTPMNRSQGGESHWWLLDAHGKVIDLTLAPGDKPGRFPYEEGVRRSFRKGKGRDGLSEAAEEVVERVQRARARREARR